MKQKKSPTSRLENIKESPIENIVQAIKDDHKDLRKFGKILKSEESSMKEKKEAYKNFSSLLKSHAKSEEKAVYELCLKVNDVKLEANEGYIEHHVADSLMKEISTTKKEEKWWAQVKVLAEVVEHHADEEEKEFLPKISKDFDEKQKNQMSSKFIQLREKSQTKVSEENAGVLAKVQSSQMAMDKNA